MKHLLSSVAFVTCSLLSSGAFATTVAPTCPMPTGPAASLLRDRTDVPLDARLIFDWRANCNDDSVLVYDARGELVVATQWLHRSEFDMLQPAQLLEPRTRHRVVFTKDLQPTGELYFTTGDA